MIGNKGNSNSNAYFTRSGSFSTHGSRKGTHHLYDFELTLDQLNDSNAQIAYLTPLLTQAQKELTDIRAKLNIHKLKSPLVYLENLEKSNALKNKHYLFRNSKAEHDNLLQGVEAYKKFRKLKDLIDDIKSKNQVVNQKSIKLAFYDIALKELDKETFNKIYRLATIETDKRMKAGK
jgi:hypothetical protein